MHKFIEHFPFEEDFTLQILKGHLLVEEALREIVRLQLPHPEALNGSSGTRFDCHQIICLAEALTPESQKTPWLWKAIKKLNSLRNKLAHQLDNAGLEDKIKDLIKYVHTNSDIDLIRVYKKKGLNEDHNLIISILSINACLSGLKSIVDKKSK